ncbi:hypothetical protein [Neisseria iguanae]|uniref:Uncharacterized protein n=1 Tax=Neisseria iguanae TaxID=90242 RepID=A0A2P7U0I2_9NEIS|nr:hypothetical protein [Neisseria iguanae]PSJ80490.1 hypothetical protein C7N83_05985 [Neisseria iguanae]
MHTLSKTIIRTEPLPKNATDEAKLEKWAEISAKYGLSGEWAVASRLGETQVSEEQVETVANLFGR